MARYELLERIGVGSMAEIFRGTATAGAGFEKPVAIKRILPHLSQDERFIELLIAEAKILSELHHRNIVQIYDVGVGDDGQYFLVMEFVDGTDLSRVYEGLFGFNDRRIPVEIALHLCSELCEALEHAHNAVDEAEHPLALVHRDVSPSNVLLSKSGEVKLTDFGTAKRLDQVTSATGARGEFAYRSPEQAAHQRVDGRSDVYAVGILLYELVCGQRLFSGLSDCDAQRELRKGRVVPSALSVPGVAPKLGEIIMKALSKNPEDRYQSAGGFSTALRTYWYSQDTDIADPTAAIAALVFNTMGGARGGNSEEGLDFGGRSTIVQIRTAASFSPSGLSAPQSAQEESMERSGEARSPKSSFSRASLPRPQRANKAVPVAWPGRKPLASLATRQAPALAPANSLGSAIAYPLRSAQPAAGAEQKRKQIVAASIAAAVLGVAIAIPWGGKPESGPGISDAGATRAPDASETRITGASDQAALKSKTALKNSIRKRQRGRGAAKHSKNKSLDENKPKSKLLRRAKAKNKPKRRGRAKAKNKPKRRVD